MANWNTLKTAVAEVINSNGNQEITGQLLQNVLNNIITNIGENATFAGIATLDTNPGAPDGPVFYLTATAGTYPNFNGIEVLDGEAVIFEWNNGTWTKKDSGFATQEKLSELGSFSLDTSFVGDGDNYVQKRLHLVAGRRYRIDVINPNYSRDSVSLNKRLFAIYHNEGGNTVYDYSVSKTGLETVNPFYIVDAIECLNNNRYSILVRADKDVAVNCRVQDITDVEYKAPIFVTSSNLEVIDSKTISFASLQVSTAARGYRSIQAIGTGIAKEFVFNQEDTGLVLVVDKDDKIVFRSGASTIEPTDIVLLSYSAAADRWSYGHLLPLVSQIASQSEVDSLWLRLFDTPFMGEGNTVISKYARLAPNHKYRIDIVNPNWNSSEVAESYPLFAISHRLGGNRIYDFQVLKEIGEHKVSSSYIVNSVECDNQMYQFSIRGNKGEEVFIRITDITDTEANKQRIDDVVDNIIGGGLYSSVGEPTILSDRIEGLVFGNVGEVYQTINSNYNNHVECSVLGFSSINISTILNINKNTSLTAFIVVDKNDVVLHREFYPNNESYRRNVKVSINYNLPTNASKILVQSSTSANSNVTITPVELTSLVNGINKISSEEDYVSVEGLSIVEGELEENGIVNIGNGKLTTSLLTGKFIINTTDDVIIERVIMCNLNGDILNYDWVSPIGPTDIIDWQSLYNAEENKHYFGVYNDMPDIGYKLVLSGKNGKILTKNMNLVSKYLKLESLKSTVEKNTAMYQVLRRNNQMMRIQWTCQSNIPQTVSDYLNTVFFKNGQSFISLPYSQAEEYAKMLLFDVSLRTFITSLYNPHSLFNTENISKAHSKSRYGFSYNGTNCATYYGNVCSGYTGWLMGLRGKVFTQQIPLIEGVNELEGINAYNIMPSTILLNSHHCMYIQDVLTDEYGNRKIVVLGEMTTPTAKLIPYTPERLQTRLDSESHRYFSYDRWSDVINENQGWEGDEEFALIDIERYTNGNYKFNDDICTFAGDYATFGVGDKIYLNANNKGIYSSVEVYKNDVLLTTVSLPEVVGEDEWVDIDLTDMNLDYGDYKARLTDGINSSDYTYWEILDTSSRMYRTSGNISADFTAQNCTPWSICVCQINGQYYNRETGPLIRNITDEEATEKKVVTTWNYAKSDAYVFIKFRGKYGIALKKIQCSSF